MATSLWPLTLVWTRRRSGTTWLWWVKHSASAITSDLLKDSLSTASASTSVAEILAKMLWIPTSQWLSTSARTDMLSLELLVLSGIPLSLLLRCKTC